MVGHTPPSRARAILRAGVFAALAALMPPAARADAPARVVSINLCTDQLAMMLAHPGQLVSVSFLARDPMLSAMVAEAEAYPVNHARAEAVFLMRPDLVLAGRYGAPATVSMLRRLGIEVVQVPPARSFDEIREAVRQVGRALGQEARAEAAIARFDADLAALASDPAGGPRTALYQPNGYTSGQDTLADEILAAAGMRNLAAEAGLPGGGILPLERLVMLAPDLIVTTDRYAGASRAEDLLGHPALAVLLEGQEGHLRSGADWLCGTPHVLRAVAEISRARDAREAAR